MFTLLSALHKMGLLSPTGLFRLFSSIAKYGVNVMALLGFAGIVYSDKIALVDDKEAYSYKELFLQTEKLSMDMQGIYGLTKGQKVAFLCKNHASLVKAVFAASRLGLDIYLLNVEMSNNQFNKMLEHHNFDFVVYDYELDPMVELSGFKKKKIFSYHDSLPAINNLNDYKGNIRQNLKRNSPNKIVLMSGGTTGNAKEAIHKPSLLNYLNPFITLLSRLNLIQCNTAYIVTPLYHGYGIAILFMFIALGKKIVITKGFDTHKACSLICEHHVEVITVVPLMINKMLKSCPKSLSSLRYILSGGAELSQKLVQEVNTMLGDVLCNLYGTSEAGLNIVATPQDLRYSPKTIGKKIRGVRLKVLDDRQRDVEVGRTGQFYIQNKWSVKNKSSLWIKTGDLGYCDAKGYYFLCGRIDDMIVSAGENVYPAELEHILTNHPKVQEAAVIGVKDELFGQRLKAFVLPQTTSLTQEELTEWLRPQVARYQMPREIVFVEQLPYTPLGKPDRKRLQ
jgi:fatty-acyl-CoA synthase